MRIKASVQNYKLSVLSNEGVEMLTASAENVSFDGDVAALMQEMARMSDELVDAFTKAVENGPAH